MTEHVHRFVFESPNGSPLLIGQCACGALSNPHRTSAPDFDRLTEKRLATVREKNRKGYKGMQKAMGR